MQNFRMKVAVTWINGDIEQLESRITPFPDELDLIEHLRDPCMKIYSSLETSLREGTGGFLKVLRAGGCPVHLRIDQMRSVSIRFTVNNRTIDFDDK